MQQKNTLDRLSSGKLLVSPSMLAADFSSLKDDIRKIDEAGADMVHLDVMDGHFVPNITFGPSLVKSLRKYTSLPFDVHLMISEPMKYIGSFADAGADHITFHVESNGDPEKIIREIHAKGCSAGISLKPKTPADSILPFIHDVEMILVMTVEPGFGGQSFMNEQLKKVSFYRSLVVGRQGPHIQVDGGLDEKTVKEAASAGQNCIVAGTSVFRNPDGITAAITVLHETEKYLSRGRII